MAEEMRARPQLATVVTIALALTAALPSIAAEEGSSGIVLLDRCAELGISPLSGCLAWHRETDRATGARDLAVSPDGTGLYATTGEATLALDGETGAVLWEATAVGGSQLALTPSGQHLVVADYRGAKALTTSEGIPVWDEPFEINGPLAGLGLSPDGQRLYATITVQHPQIAVHTLAYDVSDGSNFWRVVETGTISRGFSDRQLAVGSDGERIYVSMLATQPGNHAHTKVVAYDAKSGTRLWSRSEAYLPPPVGASSIADQILAGPGDRVYVVSGENAASLPETEQVVVRAYRGASGHTLWTTVFLGVLGPQGSLVTSPGDSAILNPQGSRLFLTMSEDVGPFSWRGVHTYALDAATGLVVWDAHHPPQLPKPISLPRDIAISKDGNRLYMGGYVRSPGSANDHDWLAVAYDATTGVEIWSSVSDSGTYDILSSVTVNPVSGTTYLGGTMDSTNLTVEAYFTDPLA